MGLGSILGACARESRLSNEANITVPFIIAVFRFVLSSLGHYINRGIIGDIAKIEDWSRSVSASNSHGLDLPGQASPTKQSEGLGG